MTRARGVEGTRVLRGLRAMTARYSADEIDAACEVA